LSKDKIIGSDEIARATGYYTSRKALTRALEREREKLLALYGGSPDHSLFWFEAEDEGPVAYSEATQQQRSSRKWKLCSRPEYARAFGNLMRQFNENIRPAVNAYLTSESERRARMVIKSPYLPIEVLRRKIQDNSDQFQPDWESEQDAFNEQYLAENCDVPEVAMEIIRQKLANGRPRTFEFISNIVDGFTVRAIREMLLEVGAVQLDGEIEKWRLIIKPAE